MSLTSGDAVEINQDDMHLYAPSGNTTTNITFTSPVDLPAGTRFTVENSGSGTLFMNDGLDAGYNIATGDAFMFVAQSDGLWRIAELVATTAIDA